MGGWKKIWSCPSGSAMECTTQYSYGVTNIAEESYTNTLSVAIKATASMNIGMNELVAQEKFKLGLEVDGGYTHQWADSTSTEKTYGKEFTMNCEGTLYQWTMNSTMHNGINGTDFEIRSRSFLCLSGNFPPQCYPGDCQHDNKCQACCWSKKRDYDFVSWYPMIVSAGGAMKQLLGPCQGHCTEDKDCAHPDTKCYVKGESPPGCVGTTETGANYCGWKTFKEEVKRPCKP